MIYILVLLSLFVLFFLGKENKIFEYVAVLIIILLVGLRKNVGVDYESYQNIYENTDWSNIGWFQSYWLEPGFVILAKLFNTIGAPYYMFNTFIAAITLIFVYKRVGDFKEINKEFFWLIFFVSSCGYAFMVNGVRQSVAIAIFFYATRYIYSKNFIKYSIFILLASSIHFSALLLFPIYLIDKIKITPLIGVIIFTLSIILSFLHLPDKFFTVILSTFGYSNLVESGIGSVPRNTGLGIIARIIFFYAIYFLSFCKRQKVGMFFTFFVIASSWSFLFMEHMAIARVYLYFEIFSIVYILTLIKLRFSGLSYGIALMFYLIFNLTLFQATVSNPKFNLEYNCICNR